MLSRLRCVLLIIGLSAAVVGCPHPAPCAGKPASLYRDTSTINLNPANIYYHEIPNWNTNPTLDSQSTQIMAHFVESVAATGNRQPFWDAVWSVPVFFADSSVPKVNLRLTNAWSNADWLLQQRIPCWADHNDGSTDQSVGFVNLVEDCSTGVWGFNGDWENQNTFPCGETAGAYPNDTDGTGRPQMGLTGFYGVSATGLGCGIWPDELTNINNPINHGVTFAYITAHNKAGVGYDPAYKADGEGTCTYDMCEGFRIQLNPSYSYGPERKTWERKYMDALKKYGAWNSDSANFLSWSSMVSKTSCLNNPFVGIFPDEVSLETAGGWDARFPLDQFRLIARGAPITTPQNPQSNYCGEYSGWHGTPNPTPAAPTLSSISPSTAAAGSMVTLTGTNLTGTYRVFFGDKTHCTWNPTQVTTTQVICAVPAGSGTVAVSAKTGGGFSGTVSFTYSGGTPPPTLSSLSPSSGTTAGGTSVTLTGTNLSGTTAVSFGGTAATGIVNVSSTSVRCTSPAKTAGTASVTATTPGGTSNGANYTYIATPTLSSIAPTSGTTAGGTACTLTGTNLTGCSAVSFAGTAGTAISVVSATSVRCTSPAKTAGTYSVTATTPGGTSNGVNYTYTSGSGPYTATLNAVDDTYVYNLQATQAHDGTSLVVQKNYSVDWRPFLKFDLASIQGTTITSAKLRLNWWKADAQTLKVYSCATDTWTEETLTWALMPADGTQQASFALTGTAGWYEVTLTSYVNTEFAGNKIVSMVIRDDTGGNGNNVNSQCYSKESGGATNQPQLVVISN